MSLRWCAAPWLTVQIGKAAGFWPWIKLWSWWWLTVDHRGAGKRLSLIWMQEWLWLAVPSAGSGMNSLEGLIGAEEKVINSKSKINENVVRPPACLEHHTRFTALLCTLCQLLTPALMSLHNLTKKEQLRIIINIQFKAFMIHLDEQLNNTDSLLCKSSLL